MDLIHLMLIWMSITLTGLMHLERVSHGFCVHIQPITSIWIIIRVAKHLIILGLFLQVGPSTINTRI